MLPYIRTAATALALGLALSACNCEGGGLITLKPVWVATPEALEFGEVPVGDLRIRAFKIENKSDVRMTITRFELAEHESEFSFVTPVPMSLESRGSLDFNVMFKPGSVGEKRGTILVEANDKVGHHEITLHGIGVKADVIVTPQGDACPSGGDKSISFGRLIPGQTADRTITVKATGSAPVAVLSAIVESGSSPAFSIDPADLPKMLQPGSSFDLLAHYAPTVGGTDSGSFLITTDAATNSMIRVTACGEAVAPAICAMRLDLGNVVVGTTGTGMLHVTSCGLETVQISAIALASDTAHPTDPQFRLPNPPAVPITLAVNASVDIPVAFDARMLGPAAGFVQVSSNALGRPESFFPISAIGAQPCTLDVMPTMLSFRAASGQRMQQAVLMQNSGATACDVTSIAITQGSSVFQLLAPPAVPVSLPPAGAITLQVQYAPTSMGTMDHGLLEVVGGGVMKTVILNGATPPSGCLVDIVPSVVNFGTVPPGDVRTVGIQLNNVSHDFCTFNGASLAMGSSPDFANTAPAFGVILPGGSKTISVTYRPTVPGAATGTLVVTTNDVVSPRVNVPLFGSSQPANICVEPRALNFGPTLGTNNMSFTIYACGPRAVTVTGLDWTRPDPVFSLTNPAPALPFTLQPGQNRVVSVQFTSDMRGHTGVITVRSDDPSSPAIDVTVTGGPQIVPETAGRFMYYWQIPNPFGGDIMKLPLQGMTMATPFWGPRAGKGCSGCHSVSPDGRYVAVMEVPSFRIVDTTMGIALALPGNPININFVSWNPNVHTNPPYQYAYDDGQSVHISSVFDGHLRNLQGASERGFYQMMPSWGRNGKIAFTRAMQNATTTMMMGMGTWGVQGPADIMVVDEGGGTAVAVPGASGNRMANYYPQFSPNGQWIAFTQSAAAQSSIAAADAQLRMVRSDMSGTVSSCAQINGTQGGATSYPTWSVDGSFLSFSSNRPGGAGGWDIYVAPVDQVSGTDSPGVNVRQANTPAFEHAAQWSP